MIILINFKKNFISRKIRLFINASIIDNFGTRWQKNLRSKCSNLLHVYNDVVCYYVAKFIAEERRVCRVRSRINVDLIATLLMKLERLHVPYILLRLWRIQFLTYRQILVLFDFLFSTDISFPSRRLPLLYFQMEF